MNALFQNVLTASFHGSIVIAAVLLLRLVLKKAPKKFSCFLWLLVGIRLLMPFEIQSSLSLQPEQPPVAQTQWQETIPGSGIVEAAPGVPEAQYPVTPEAPVPEEEAPVYVVMGGESAVETPERTPEAPVPAVNWMALVPWFWASVASCFLFYSIYAYLRLKYLVREAVKIPGGWECDRIETAFILGFIRPRIYIPMGMSEGDRKHILAHERTHLEKGDHWIKMIGYIALAIHWFNPLVWLAYVLLCKDIEIACDERVVQFMDLEERKRYSAALLSCSTNRAHFAACPVAFGEVSVKSRIQSVLKYKKPSFWISLLAVAAIIFVAVCLVTTPAKEETAAEGGNVAVESTDPAEEGNVVVVSTVDELLAAIAPDTVIRMEAGTYDLTQASTYGQLSDNPYYGWTHCYDGYQLELYNVENLTVQGSGRHVTELVTQPRYANVLLLQNCSNVVLEDFTAGHTVQQGACSGGVIYLRESSNVEMHRLGIYGCGVVGLRSEFSQNVVLTDSDIYDCSSSAVTLTDSYQVTVSGCRMYRIGSENYGGYTFLAMDSSQGVTVENCEFSDSTLQHLVQASGCEAVLRGNLFKNNRPVDSAFALNGFGVVLQDNKFENNAIRSWYSALSNYAVDENGDPLTEEILAGDQPTEPTQPPQAQLEIHVSTVDEFIAAIGPDRAIILDAPLYDLSTATGYGTASGDYYYWEDIFDGPGLIIRNVSNMTIRSNDGKHTEHTISAIPRYADVLTFRACSNITVSGFTAGHTKEPGSCAGGVLEFYDCDQITVDNCGLFGCGILGVQADNCSNIIVQNCDIYECSQGGIKMWNTSGIVIEGTAFRDIGGENMHFNACADVTVDGENLIAEGTYGSLTLESPDQRDLRLLNETMWNFARFYFDGEKDGIMSLLSRDFTGEITVYEGAEPVYSINWFEIEPDALVILESDGRCQIQIPYRETQDSDFAYIHAIVVWEGDEFKIVEYGPGG